MTEKAPYKKRKTPKYSPHPLFRLGLSPGAIALYFLLESLADNKREVRISRQNISSLFGASVPTIIKYTLELQMAGNTLGCPPLVSFPTEIHQGSKAALYKLITKEKLFSLRF